MQVKVKRLHPDAVIPVYAKDGDSGFDLVAVEDMLIRRGQTALVEIGLAFEIPEGYEMQVRPRSGITSKTSLKVQLGTVDAGYRGEVKVIVDNVSQDDWSNMARLVDNTYSKGINRSSLAGSYLIKKGDRIAQGVICPVARVELIETDSLTESERDTGGFGSTGV